MYSFDIDKVGRLEIETVLQWYLMASYMYYILNRPIFEDSYYNALSVRLLQEYDTFEHEHKYIITKESLSSGTLRNLGYENYPAIVRNSAWKFGELIRHSKLEEVIY